MKSSLLLAIVFSFSFSTITYSQCILYPVSLDQRVQQSGIVVEGKVISVKSFQDASRSMIYTANEISIYKVFKGNPASGRIIVVTEGGTVENEMVIVQPGIQLTTGQAGMFFVHVGKTYTSLAGETFNYELYSAAQGFIIYDLAEQTAHDPFSTYENIETTLYKPILQSTGNTSFKEIKPVDFFEPVEDQGLATPVISSFSPNPTYAGTLGANVFTISGSNFGSSYVAGTSKVQFKNANDGGSTYFTAPDNHIKTWSSSTITMWIPTGAGNGKIKVTNNSGETGTSSGTVTINYNESNVVSGGTYYLPDLINDNSSGGYTYAYNTTFNSNTSAVAAFERALQTWRCNTFANFTRSGTTSIAVNASDGVNVVTFDGSSSLPDGVLATAYSYYTSCATGVWYLTESDLKIRTNGTDDIDWNYGPGATTSGFYDFETVVLHELGHAHLLGHTNLSPATVMHYALSSGTDRRTLTTTSEIDGGEDVMARSVITNSCGPSKMTALTSGDCAFAGAPVANFTVSATSVCKNKTLDFTDLSTNSPTSWLWSFPGATPSSSTAQNPSGIKYTTVGTQSVTLTATNSSGSDSETKSGYITVNSLPSITISAAPCSGGAVLLTATASPSTGITYKWKKDGANISGATASTYSATVDGSYKCEVKITATGCKKTSSALTVDVSCKLGSEEWAGNPVVYPNPSASSFTIEFTASEDRIVRIFDVTGQLIREEVINRELNQFTSGGDLLPGIYFIEVLQNGKAHRVKWVKLEQ